VTNRCFFLILQDTVLTQNDMLNSVGTLMCAVNLPPVKVVQNLPKSVETCRSY